MQQIPFADPLSGLAQTRPLSSLLGRDLEMQMVGALLDVVALDLTVGARALTISGEIGVGKTRLLAELCLAAKSRGFRVLQASAFAASSKFPYLPFIEALRPVLRSSGTEQLHTYLGLRPSSSPQNTYHDGTDDISIALSGRPLFAALARLFPELLTLFPMEVSEEVLSADQEKFRLFDALATFLEHLALEQPVLLCLDNLQWADSVSLELTLYLTVRLHHCRVALVGVTRPPGMRDGSEEESSDAMLVATQTFAELMRQGLLMYLPLGPLSAEAAAQHLHALLPGLQSSEVEQLLLARAEGNPFFLEELVRTALLQQQLIFQDGSWSSTRLFTINLPESLLRAVELRLQELSASCLELLQIAALCGRSFAENVLLGVIALLEVTPFSSLRWQTTLTEALHAAVIVQVPAKGEETGQGYEAQTTYTFCQGIVQEVLQAQVVGQRIGSYHRAIGQVLEASYAHDAANHAVELVQHFMLAGEQEASIHWSLIAGENAARQQAYREALNHYRLALQLVEMQKSASDNVCLQIRLTIGELCFRLGELEQATSAFQSTLEQMSYSHAPSALFVARTNRLLADVYRMQAKYDLAISHLQVAQSALNADAVGNDTLVAIPTMQVPWLMGRRIVGDIGNAQQIHATERILLLQAQGLLNLFLNRKQDAQRVFWESHQLAVEMADRGSQAFALHMLGWIYGWGEQIHEGIRLQEQAHDLYIAIGDPFRAALGDQGLGIIYQALGEMERAHLYTLRGFERARRYGVRRILGWLYWNQGVMALNQGHWESSASHLQQALQEAVTQNDKRLRPVVLQAQAELQFHSGDWQAAEQLFLAAFQAAINTEWQPGAQALYGHFLAVTGRHSAALSQLDGAAAFPEPPGFAGDFYIPFLAEGYIHLHLAQRASAYIQRIKKLHGFMYYATSVDRILAEVAIVDEDWPTAERAFAEGLLLCKRAHNQPEEAAILYEQARMEVVRGGTQEQIAQLCARAHTLFLQYKMQRAADLVVVLQEGAQQIKSSDRGAGFRNNAIPSREGERAGNAFPVHLTKRELEVLCLVAEGYTDKEVAEMLIISPRTINRHLSNIYTKLVVPGRAAAVAYAVRLKLV